MAADGFFSRLRRRVAPTRTAGDSGTAIYGGIPLEVERDRRLVGREKYNTYSNILANTTIAAAGVRLYLNLLGKSAWKAESADANNAQAEEAAEFLEEVMNKTETPWRRIVRRAGMYRMYGYSVQEWTARRREDGRIDMLDIEPRPQVTIERWDCENDRGVVQGVVQRSAQTSEEIYLPRSKIIYVVDDALNDSPEGLGIFRHLADPSTKLKRYELLEAYGFEIDLRGIPIGRAPLALLQKQVESGEISEEQKTTILDPITKFLANHIKNPKLALMLDSTPYRGTGDQQTPSATQHWGVDLLQGDSNGAEPVNLAIERINREIARLLGVEFLMLGTTGSQALSRDKTSTFNVNVESALDEIRETYERDFLPVVMNLNGFPEEVWPKLTTETVQFREVEEITAGLKDLAAAMLQPDDPAINEVREILGLSPVPEELTDLLMEERQTRVDLERQALEQGPGNNREGDDDE